MGVTSTVSTAGLRAAAELTGTSTSCSVGVSSTAGLARTTGTGTAGTAAGVGGATIGTMRAPVPITRLVTQMYAAHTDLLRGEAFGIFLLFVRRVMVCVVHVMQALDAGFAATRIRGV